MGKIDDPLDQVDFVHDSDIPQGLVIGGGLGSILVGLLNPQVGALTSVAAFVTQFVDQSRKEARAEAVRNGLRDKVKGIEVDLADLREKVSGPEAEDAINVGVRAALASARLDKARMFGQILGGTLTQDSPNWQEAAEFIRTIEQFSDIDIEALKILWKVQKTAYRRRKGEKQLEMSSSLDEFSKTWTDVLDHAGKARISNDDWYSRCARLTGFGLVVLVQANPSYQRAGEMCYRLTTRGIRLLGLLGRNVDPGAYPSVRYHPNGSNVTVPDEDADAALGPGWYDTPNKFPKPGA